MDRKELSLLVVEDNIMMQKMLVHMLEGLDFRKITTANNGGEAWKKLNNDESFDLILSDLVMPKVNGIELLNKVRASERFWELPFIMITGEENQSQLMSSIEVEVDSYILKPFTPIKLESEINRVLEQKYKPSPYQLALQQGRTLLAQGGDSEATLKAFEEASLLQPKEADPYYFSAIIHERQGRRAEAKACLDKCIQIKEAYPKAYDLLGLIYHRDKDYAAERKILKKICELSPNNVERNLTLALACAKLGDQEGVRKYLKVAARHADPADLATYDRVFRIYLEEGSMTAEAEVVYRKYIDKNLENPRLLNKYALLLKTAKAFDRTIFLLERIVHIWRTEKNHGIPPEDMAVYYFNLSVAYIEQANTFPDPAQKKTGYQNAEKLIHKAMDCNVKHADSAKLCRWLTERLVEM